jgi:hypothetical protein
MNTNPKSKFSKENQPPNENKRKKKRKTIVKEQLGLKNIDDLKDDVLMIWKELVRKGTKEEKKYAAKEISKYLFAQKKEITGDMSFKFEDWLKGQEKEVDKYGV